MTAAFQPNDRVRVLVDEPYSTEMHAGDIVTVIETATKLESDGREIPVVIVSTDHGQRILGLDAVELYHRPGDYKPAEPDEVVDGIFEKMIRADRDLFVLAQDADTALGAQDEKLSAQLAAAVAEHDHEIQNDSPTGWTMPGDGNSFRIRDYAGDTLEVFYAEQECPEHGREGAFFFVMNEDETVLLPVAYVDQLIRFLFDRRRFSERPD